MAQNDKKATELLDKAAASFKSAGGVKAMYTFSAYGQQGRGTIWMLGQKFKNDMGDHIIWFDGKTMWTLVKQNEEVNVTEPTSSEIASMNPYAFLSLYKKGYKATLGKSTSSLHEIILTSTSKQNSGSRIVLRLNKTNLTPAYIKMSGADGNAMEITINSFEKGQKLNNTNFTFNHKNYPNYDIVDLR